MPLGAFLIAKPFQLAPLCLDMRIGNCCLAGSPSHRASATPSAGFSGRLVMCGLLVFVDGFSLFERKGPCATPRGSPIQRRRARIARFRFPCRANGAGRSSASLRRLATRPGNSSTPPRPARVGRCHGKPVAGAPLYSWCRRGTLSPS